MKDVSASINGVKGSSVLPALYCDFCNLELFPSKTKKKVFKNEDNIMPFHNVCELAKMNQFMMSAVRVLSLPGRAETGMGAGTTQWEHLNSWV